MQPFVIEGLFFIIFSFEFEARQPQKITAEHVCLYNGSSLLKKTFETS